MTGRQNNKRNQRHSEYESFQWQIVSAKIKIRDGFKCQVCGSNDKLEVHHKFYFPDRKIWDYDSDTLITLCRNCHDAEHIAIDYINKLGIDISGNILLGMSARDVWKKMKKKENVIALSRQQIILSFN